MSFHICVLVSDKVTKDCPGRTRVIPSSTDSKDVRETKESISEHERTGPQYRGGAMTDNAFNSGHENIFSLTVVACCFIVSWRTLIIQDLVAL